MDIIFYIIFIVSGLIIGSFLSVLIYRLPRSISIRKSSSFCPSCKKSISYYDRIPIISYLILKGRCRQCGDLIHMRYPVVEIITATLFYLNYSIFGISVQTLSGILFCCALIIVTFIDMEFKLIPDIIILPFSIVGLALSIAFNPSSWWIILSAAFGAFIFMFIIHLIYPKGMGMGDVKLSFMVGAFISLNVVIALFLSFLIGALFGVFMLILGKRKLKNTFAFGPFIALGSIVALFYGNTILNWYLSMF
jgi:prepilin signal peptidase PulO-like enzyme (type II secretory pathway)